jgi:hypothetical protein
MDGKTIATLIVTIVIAFIGFIVKYINDVAVARRKDKLERVNLQLKNLYGPLYATLQASEITWRAFRSSYRPGKAFFGTEPPPTDEELAAWRLWMAEVFMPLNLRLEKTIVENGDLIIEKEMPECFLRLCAHVAAYKPVLKKWESNDFSEHSSVNNFPTDLSQYVESSYSYLKNRQEALLGELHVKDDA